MHEYLKKHLYINSLNHIMKTIFIFYQRIKYFTSRKISLGNEVDKFWVSIIYIGVCACV